MSPASLKAQIAIGVAAAGTFLWFLPAIDRWVKREAVARPTLVIRVQCDRPKSPAEQLVVLVDDRGIAANCFYVTSRGEARRGLPPKPGK